MTVRDQAKRIQQTFILEFAAGLARTAVPLALLYALGAAEYGFFVSATTVAMLVYHLGCAGIPLSCSYFTAARPGRATERRLLLWAGLISIAAVLLCVAPAFAYREKALSHLPWSVLLISLLMVPPLTIEATSLAILRGEARNQYAAVLNATRNLALLLIVMLSAFWFKLELGTAILASGGIGLLVVLPTVIAKLKHSTASNPQNAPGIREFSAYALPSHLGALITFLNYRVDLLIVASLCSAELTGVYGIFVSLAEAIWFFSLVLSAILMADVAAAKSRDLAWLNTARTTRLVSGGCTALLLVTIPTLPFVLELVLPAHAHLWPVLAVALGSAVVLTPSRLLATHRAALGAPEANLPASLLGMAINVIGTLAFVPIWGLVGAALATLIAYMVICGERIRWFLSAAPTSNPASLRDVLVPTHDDLRLVFQEVLHFVRRSPHDQ